MPKFLSNLPFLAGVGLSLALFSILAGPTGIWSLSLTGGALFSTKHGLAIGFLLALPWLWGCMRDRELTPPSAEGFAAGLFFVVFTDWLSRGYNFFQGPSIRGELFLVAALVFFLHSKFSTRFWLTFAALAVVGTFATFFVAADGRLLFSDDHGTFLYRLLLLRDNFPSIPFYSPLWNGGYDARDFFATGTLNVFFFAWPFVYFTDLIANYNVIVALILFLLVPAATFLASQLAGFTLGARVIAAILSLSSGLLWYRWGLSYGTLGFIVSSSLLPINLVLASRIIRPDLTISKREAILFTITTSLMLCWSLSAITLLPLAILALIFLRSLLKKRYVLSVIAALVLINLPWMLLFWSVSNVGKFLHADSTPTQIVRESSSVAEAPSQAHVKSTKKGFNPQRSLKIIRESAVSTSPLIFLLLIPGIIALPRSSRLTWGITSAWLFALGALIAPLKPQLELDRMLVLMFQIGCLPVGNLIAGLFESRKPQTTLANRLTISLVGAFLFIGPFATGAFLLGRSIMQYSFASPLVSSMTAAIKDHGGHGRILYSGFLLHEVSGGHAAPMPYWTEKPLMASSPFHNLWKYRQIFPASYLSRGYDGIKEYLDLYNVSAVMTHESEWKHYFLIDHKDDFTLTWQEGRFALFKRNSHQSNYVQSGKASDLKQDTSSITLTPQTPEVVLKFNYLPFLTSTSCQISGQQFAPEVSLIKLSNCTPGAEVTISSKSAWSRL